MYCPNCGQQQAYGEMRFCSRCGLALSGLAEWLAADRGLTPRRQGHLELNEPSPQQKGIRRAAKLMFFSGVLVPVALLISLAVDEGVPLLLPVLVFFIALVMMLYARWFSDPAAPAKQTYQASLESGPTRAPSLPPATNMPIPAAERRRVRTNELAQPASVTENTTRLLDDE